MMKSKIALAVAIGLAASSVVAGPIVLPTSPLFIQYLNVEQVSTSNDIGNILNRQRTPAWPPARRAIGAYCKLRI